MCFRMETMLVDGSTLAQVKDHYDKNRKTIEARFSLKIIPVFTGLLFACTSHIKI